jgi:peptidylprolyl isomerase
VKRFAPIFLALCMSLPLVACGSESSTEASEPGSTGASGEGTWKRSKPEVDPPDGSPPKQLVVKDLVKGSGATIKEHTVITTRYVAVDYETGEMLEDEWAPPFSIEFAPGKEIKAWEQGLKGMKTGGRRELIVPPELAYGGTATRIYVIDLLLVK